MKITNVKAMVAKTFTVGLLAGAVVMAAPTKAEAQFRVGVFIGPPVRAPYVRGPVYVAPAPVYGYYGRYDRDRWEDRRDFDRERFEHERYEHERFEHRDFDRDRR